MSTSQESVGKASNVIILPHYQIKDDGVEIINAKSTTKVPMYTRMTLSLSYLLVSMILSQYL
eukprot:scaffold168322_cov19-Prasinocladus_malaysianus.AAC.2